MRKSLSMPLSPPGWTTVMHSSSGSLAKAYRNCSTSRIVLLGSWWGCANTIISHPFSNHYTGFLFHSELFTRTLSLPIISASMVMPHHILRNSLLHNLPNVHSVLLQHILKPPGLSFALWEIGISAQLLRICGMLSRIIYGLHNLSMFLEWPQNLPFSKTFEWFKKKKNFFLLVLICSTLGFCVNIKCITNKMYYYYYYYINKFNHVTFFHYK